MPIDVVDVVWNDFLQRFLEGEIVYVTEQQTRYVLMTADNHFIVRTVYPKGRDYAENINFITRYLQGRNIVWTTSFEDEVIVDEEIDEEKEEYEVEDNGSD